GRRRAPFTTPFTWASTSFAAPRSLGVDVRARRVRSGPRGNSGARDDADAVVGADDHRVDHAAEETVLRDARHRRQRRREPRRIVEGSHLAIEDPEAVVGDVGFAVALSKRGLEPEPAKGALDDLDGERNDFDGKREGVQLVDE